MCSDWKIRLVDASSSYIIAQADNNYYSPRHTHIYNRGSRCDAHYFKLFARDNQEAYRTKSMGDARIKIPDMTVFATGTIFSGWSTAYTRAIS
jgi:hypothetical protein